MGSLSEARIFGGVGSILLVLAVLPTIPLLGTAFTLVGYVLILFAVKFISDELRNRKIFVYYLLAALFAFVGVVVAGMLLIAALAQLPFLEDILQPLIPLPGFTESAFLNLLIGLILALVIVWVAYIASAIFLRRSFESIALGLSVESFSTAALVYLIGAILIVVLVGFLVIVVAHVIQAIAFFSLPTHGQAASESP